MKRIAQLACIFIVSILGATALAQDQQPDSIDLAPGIKLTPNGVISIGDLSAEVGHFDGNWTISEQHDAFRPPATTSPSTQPSSHIVSGVYDSAGGKFNLTEQFDTTDAGVHVTASITSDKPVDTNELYLSLSLPVDTVGGKQAMFDDEPTLLPKEAAKQGEAQLLAKDGVHKIEIPTPTGTLTLTGNLNVYLQDDREWDNDRFSLRLNFTPSSGQIKSSAIDFQMSWKPTAK
jgi:hypothetical protein